MVPQYSIDPEDVEDARYNMFYQPELNAGMRVEAQDIDPACEYIIVYDPYCAEDRVHYLTLEALIPHHHVLHLHLTGHDAIAVLVSSELLYDLLRHDDEPSYF